MCFGYKIWCIIISYSSTFCALSSFFLSFFLLLLLLGCLKIFSFNLSLGQSLSHRSVRINFFFLIFWFFLPCSVGTDEIRLRG